MILDRLPFKLLAAVSLNQHRLFHDLTRSSHCALSGLSSAATGGEYNQSLADTGSALLVAGVAFQAANMIAAGLVMLHFMWRYKKAKSSGVQMEEPTTQRDEKSSKRFTLFCWAIAVGFVTIIIRCIYRCVSTAGFTMCSFRV